MNVATLLICRLILILNNRTNGLLMYKDLKVAEHAVLNDIVDYL